MLSNVSRVKSGNEGEAANEGVGETSEDNDNDTRPNLQTTDTDVRRLDFLRGRKPNQLTEQEKKEKLRLQNRESARKLRRRRTEQMESLQEEVSRLHTENKALLCRLKEVGDLYQQLQKEFMGLKQENMYLSRLIPVQVRPGSMAARLPHQASTASFQSASQHSHSSSLALHRFTTPTPTPSDLALSTSPAVPPLQQLVIHRAPTPSGLTRLGSHTSHSPPHSNLHHANPPSHSPSEGLSHLPSHPCPSPSLNASYPVHISTRPQSPSYFATLGSLPRSHTLSTSLSRAHSTGGASLPYPPALDVDMSSASLPLSHGAHGMEVGVGGAGQMRDLSPHYLQHRRSKSLGGLDGGGGMNSLGSDDIAVKQEAHRDHQAELSDTQAAASDYPHSLNPLVKPMPSDPHHAWLSMSGPAGRYDGYS